MFGVEHTLRCKEKKRPRSVSSLLKVNKLVGNVVLFFSSPLVLLSQKVATNDEENHLFGKIHTSAMGGWNGSAKIE